MTLSPDKLHQTALQRILGTKPIIICPYLATLIGVTNAICWQQLNYWVSNESIKNIFDGKRWVYNTYAQWRKQLPFLSEITIKRSFLQLEEMGLIVTRRDGQHKYYSIDYKAVTSFLETDISDQKLEEISKGEDAYQDDTPYQNDTGVVSKRYDGRIKMIRSYIDTESTQRLPRDREIHFSNSSLSPSLSSNSFQEEDVLPSSTIESNPKKSRKESTARGTRLPEEWELPGEWRQWALEAGLFNEQIDLQAEKFKCYWCSTTKNPTKINWFMTWKNWCYDNLKNNGTAINISKPKPVLQPEKPQQAAIFSQQKSSDPLIQRWYELQPLLRETMGEDNYDSWIVGNLELVKIGDTATFRVKSSFYADRIQQHYGLALAAVLAKINPLFQDHKRIEFIFEGSNSAPKLETKPSCQDSFNVNSPTNLGNMRSIGDVIGGLGMP